MIIKTLLSYTYWSMLAAALNIFVPRENVVQKVSPWAVKSWKA